MAAVARRATQPRPPVRRIARTEPPRAPRGIPSPDPERAWGEGEEADEPSYTWPASGPGVGRGLLRRGGVGARPPPASPQRAAAPGARPIAPRAPTPRRHPPGHAP